MALAVAALAAEGETEIEDASCAAVSFPEFYDLLARGREQGRRA
jgi:5-enolpyruvylshikimate-3-phosphate synthase